MAAPPWLPYCRGVSRGRHSVERLVGPSHGREVRGGSSAPEEYATHPPSRPVRDFRCSERKESEVAPHTASVTPASQPPARESTCCRRAARCVAPQRAPARIPGTPCRSDQRPGSTGPGSGRKGWRPNPGRTPRALLPADSLGDPPHSRATIATGAVENTPPPHEAGWHTQGGCRSPLQNCPGRHRHPKRLGPCDHQRRPHAPAQTCRCSGTGESEDESPWTPATT